MLQLIDNADWIWKSELIVIAESHYNAMKVTLSTEIKSFSVLLRAGACSVKTCRHEKKIHDLDVIIKMDEKVFFFIWFVYECFNLIFG